MKIICRVALWGVVSMTIASVCSLFVVSGIQFWFAGNVAAGLFFWSGVSVLLIVLFGWLYETFHGCGGTGFRTVEVGSIDAAGNPAGYQRVACDGCRRCRSTKPRVR